MGIEGQDGRIDLTTVIMIIVHNPKLICSSAKQRPSACPIHISQTFWPRCRVPVQTTCHSQIKTQVANGGDAAKATWG